MSFLRSEIFWAKALRAGDFFNLRINPEAIQFYLPCSFNSKK